MIIRTILIDDEPRGIASMERLLHLNCPEVQVIAACSSADTAFKAINQLNPELVFLDIGMPVKSGFDLLRELKEFNFEVVFVTAHNQFTVDAFHFSAVDYLLKPVDDDLLIDAVRRARKRIEDKAGGKNIETFLHNLQQQRSRQQLKLCLPSLKGFQVVDLEEIVYAESSGNYTNFHFCNKTIICTSKPLHEYETLLSDAGFVRIHKCSLVNLRHVKEYIRGEGGTVVLSTGQQVEVSRRRKEELLAMIKSHYKY